MCWRRGILESQNEIDWAASDYIYHYNDVEPIHAGLMQNPPLNVETSHHSSSVTVSIFGALSEILSHTTESLSFLTSTTTEHTPLSHTHSTFLSTDNTQTQIQSNRNSIDLPKSRNIKSSESTTTSTPPTTTTAESFDSDEFQLPILNAFESNEAITSNKSSTSSSTSNEQVDTLLSNSSHSPPSTMQSISSTVEPALESHSSQSSNDTNIDEMHSKHHRNSSDVMIVLATSDKSSSMPHGINRMPHAIQHTQRPFHMPAINLTLADTEPMLIVTSSTDQVPTTRSSDTVMSVYPVYASTMLPSPNVPISNTSDPIQMTIDRPDNMTTSMPPTTTTTMTLADFNRTETNTERSSNSVNITLYDLDDNKLIKNNELNVTRLNRIVNLLLNRYPLDRGQTLTNTKHLLNDLTIATENETERSTVDIETETSDTESVEVTTIENDAPTTFALETMDSEPIETTDIQDDEMPSSTTSYVPQLINRIPILPIDSYNSAKQLTIQQISTPSPSKMIIQAPSSTNETPSTVNPMKMITTARSTSLPSQVNQIMTASPPQHSTTPHKSRRFDFVVYGVLGNNTVVRRYPEDIYDDESEEKMEKDVRIVYGILANHTVLRKYPNGTTEIDEKRSSRKFEITDINPIHLYNPFSSIYMQQPESIKDQSSNRDSRSHSNSHTLSTNIKSPFNLNNINTTPATSPFSYIIANSTTAPPTTVFKLPQFYCHSCLFVVPCFFFLCGGSFSIFCGCVYSLVSQV